MSKCSITYDQNGNKIGVSQNNELFQEILNNPQIKNFDEALSVFLETYSGEFELNANNINGFYSNAEQSLLNLKDKNPKNVKGWISQLTDTQKNGGIKNVNQELEWIGLEDYLNEYVKENNPKAGNIPSSVVEDYIKSNQIEIVDISKEDYLKPVSLTFKKLNEFDEDDYGSTISSYETIEEVYEDDEVGYQIVKTDEGYYVRDERTDNVYRDDNYENNLFSTFEEAVRIAGVHLADKNKTSTEGTKYEGYQLKGGDAPLAKDTEILTDKGWVSIGSVSIGDNVLTRRDIDGVVEYKPVQAKPEVYSEFLYKYESPSIYLETTAKHTMVVERPRGSGDNYRWETERVTTEDLWKLPNRRIPLTGIWNGEFVENIYGYNSVDIAEFIGWYIAEGHCVHDKVTNNKSTVCIAQKKSVNKEKCERLEKLFDRLGFNWSYCSDNHYYISCKTLTKELKDVLYSMPKSLEKDIPKELLKTDKTIMGSLLNGLILGDGCIVPSHDGRKERKMYHTASFKLASDVQTLATLLGYASTITKRDKNYKNTLYVVSFKESKYCWVDNVKKEIIPYNDVAYCVTVENHAIYVRKNGRAVFTGNSTYREVLLTMPSKRTDITESQKVLEEASLGNLSYDSQEVKDAQKTIDKYNSENKDEYTSSHWDEKNILAHVRLNEKTLPDGRRVLIVNEIQSDSGQAIKKDEDFILKEIENNFDNIYNKLLKSGIIKEDC